MNTEYEVKFYPIDKGELRKKLHEIGSKLVFPERKMRRLIVDGRFNPQFKCHYIRLRDEGNLVRLSAKTHANTSGKLSDQKELDVVVSDFNKTKRIIEAMGYKFDNYQETLRETWEYQGSEIVIDIWPGLKPCLEIEEKSEREVKKIAKILGFDWSERIITSRVEIYMKVYKAQSRRSTQKTFKRDFREKSF